MLIIYIYITILNFLFFSFERSSLETKLHEFYIGDAITKMSTPRYWGDEEALLYRCRVNNRYNKISFNPTDQDSTKKKKKIRYSNG